MDLLPFIWCLSPISRLTNVSVLHFLNIFFESRTFLCIQSYTLRITRLDSSNNSLCTATEITPSNRTSLKIFVRGFFWPKFFFPFENKFINSNEWWWKEFLSEKQSFNCYYANGKSFGFNVSRIHDFHRNIYKTDISWIPDSIDYKVGW